MMRPTPAPRKAPVSLLSSPSSRAFQPFRSRRGLLFLAALSVLAGLSLATAVLLQLRNRGPERIIILRTTGPDLDVFQSEALTVFLQDHVEALGGPPVGTVADLPGPELLAALGDRTLVIHPIARRQGSQLSLELRRTWSGALRRGTPDWQGSVLPPGPPGSVLQQALEDLPLRLRPNTGFRLMPREPGCFWDLLRAQGWHRLHDRLEEAQRLAERVIQTEGDCATAWLVHGDILYRRLLSDPRSLPNAMETTEASLLAVLERVPGHPRATFVLAELHTDAGNQRAALEFLREAQGQNPQAAPVYAGLAYAARTAGLLDLARRALERRSQLVPAALTVFSAENTFLYLDDSAAFEATLLERPDNPRNVTVRFYRGYLALARGRREEARSWFDRAAALGDGFGEFRQLSLAYGHIAAGRDAKALEVLQTLERQRTGLRIPDGEFTFKMAEAHALLGRREAALDLLIRASAQGFGCARWYRKSPFLHPLRSAPRWPSLLARLEEREALLASRFKPRDFGL